MSCACEHKKLRGDIDRARRLAKSLAQIEHDTVAIVINDDGTYGFCTVSDNINKPIVEYVTEY